MRRGKCGSRWTSSHILRQEKEGESSKGFGNCCHTKSCRESFTNSALKAGKRKERERSCLPGVCVCVYMWPNFPLHSLDKRMKMRRGYKAGRETRTGLQEKEKKGWRKANRTSVSSPFPFYWFRAFNEITLYIYISLLLPLHSSSFHHSWNFMGKNNILPWTWLQRNKWRQGAVRVRRRERERGLWVKEMGTQSNGM